MSVARTAAAALWVCPFCRGELDRSACTSCGTTFPVVDGQPDFVPRGPVELGVAWTYDPEFGRFPWELVQVDWPVIENNVELGSRTDTAERRMLQCVPRGHGVALDIGCGRDRQRFQTGLASLGYSPVGVDTAGSAADALADAHLLPLADASVDLLMSHAVWEHLKNPHRAMSEAARVARAGALFVGSIAFSEPFHISYFHHSPLAVYELLASNGFDVERFVLVDRYSAFYAHLHMGYAGKIVPSIAHRPLANLVWALSLLPAALTGRLASARLGFARSHAAGVGFVARRR